MSQKRFTKDHEYVSVEGDIGTIGISIYAQQQLGDIVFVELPDVGKSLNPGDEAAVVESVKAASEIYAPVAGEVTEINEVLNETPEMVNEEPEGKAWFLKIRLTDATQLDALMDAEAYKEYVEGLS